MSSPRGLFKRRMMGYPREIGSRMTLMRLPLLAALATVTALTACGGFRESRLNPFNWFGRSQQVATVAPDETGDKRPLVDNVLSMVVEKTPGGAIVRATGISPTQGYYDAELVARPLDENGVLVYDFRIMPPPFSKPVGVNRTREVTVAAALSNIKLDVISQIVVQGANNARSSGR
jgi:hypothetical protein